MSGSFGIESGKIICRKDGRVVSTTDGTLVLLTSSANDYVQTINVAFPDFNKDYLYNWNWVTDYFSNPVGDDKMALDNACSTQITVVPQEWSQTTILAAAPSGSDFFSASVRINRTNAPSHSWGGSSIAVLVKENQWIPFSGSVLVEAEIGMARAFSLYLSGGNLVLHRQQSISTAPGGYGTYGDSPGFHDATGGENVFGTAAGIGVYQRDLKNSPATEIDPVTVISPTRKETHRRGGPQACATSDPTDYSSTYSVEIDGKFGRRS